MKKTLYRDSEGNPVVLNGDLEQELQASAFHALKQFSIIPIYVYGLQATIAMAFAVLAGIGYLATGDTEHAFVIFIILAVGTLLNTAVVWIWFSLVKKEPWAYRAALIQSYICLIFLPIGTTISLFAIRRLRDARDNFVGEDEAA